MLISSTFQLLGEKAMINTIPGWDWLKNEKAIDNGEPWQYVAFTTSRNICPVFDDGCKTAIATIGQRDGEGRLYQSWTLQHPHFAPRKITVTAENAETQIKVIRLLTLGLNNKRIDPDTIPAKVSSNYSWQAIVELLKVSGGADNA